MILAVALLVLGPTKLPELARSLGRGIREFRRATEDFKSTIDEEMNKPEPAPHRKQLAAAERKEDEPQPPQVSDEAAEPLQPLAPESPVVERTPTTVHAHAPKSPEDSPSAETGEDRSTGAAADASKPGGSAASGFPPRPESQPAPSSATTDESSSSESKA